MSAHTPGPWRTGAGNLLIIRAGEGHGMAVADIAPPTTRYPDIASEANARLIASSPELFDLVAKLLPYAESRAEDMSENVDSIPADQTESRAEAQGYADKAWAAVSAARALLAKFGVVS